MTAVDSSNAKSIVMDGLGIGGSSAVSADASSSTSANIFTNVSSGLGNYNFVQNFTQARINQSLKPIQNLKLDAPTITTEGEWTVTTYNETISGDTSCDSGSLTLNGTYTGYSKERDSTDYSSGSFESCFGKPIPTQMEIIVIMLVS